MIIFRNLLSQMKQLLRTFSKSLKFSYNSYADKFYCSPDYPFAYYNGDYCCKYNQEKPGGGYTSQIESGVCDGIGFSRESTCCKDNAYQPCINSKGCFNYQGCKY